ncbi:MAG: hypothetical protein KDA85_01055 [Planctomycetaceae bacterium]|nr:hypothetical protein [Planctomycetaceae bacterium]
MFVSNLIPKLSRWLQTVRLRSVRRRSRLARLAVVQTLEVRSLLTAVVMTVGEQLLLELINRARANPSAEAALFEIDLNEGLPTGTISSAPKAPLAPHQSLVNSSVSHSQEMLDFDYFDHQDLAGGFSDDRAVAAGYPTSLVGENIAFSGTTGTLDQVQEVYDAHRSLFLSEGHRENMLSESYVEAGTGIRYGVYSEGGRDYNAIMVTENFGIRSVNAFVTGVVYTDNDDDHFYSIGEAIRSGTITAVNLSTGAVYEDVIGVSGGYRISLPTGSYSLTAEYTIGNTTYSPTFPVTVGAVNVKRDFETGSVPLGTLTVTAARSWVAESGAENSLTLQVTRTGSTVAALMVSLHTGDPSELSIPLSVTIPAGQSSASVTVAGVADLQIDRDQDSTVLVSAAGFTDASLTITTVDVDIPSLPVGIQNSTSARPTFSWTSVADAARYELWVSAAGGNSSPVIHQTDVTSTTFVPNADLGLGTWLVWVRGINGAGLPGKWSPAATWVVRTRAVVHDNGAVLLTSDPALSWNPVTGAAAYDLWIDRLTDGTSQYYRNRQITSTSQLVAGLEVGTYNVWIQARNASGELGTWSAPARITISTPPVDLSTVAGTLSETPVVSWNSVAGAAEYDVWVDNLLSGTSQVYRNTHVVGTSATMTGLNSSRFRVWVRARDEAGGNHRWSAPLDFTWQLGPRVIGPGGAGQAALPQFSWTAVAGAARYELWVSSLDLAVRVIHQTSLAAPKYSAVAALPTGRYRTWVRAFDSNGVASAWSPALDFTVADA